ncbi:MAG: geranylgeranylglycerol-phosphate geranylgeranyltransferase [Thermoproteota archaeon]|nr:geranylgeranylglycerol-phosphate geranylgeranyltransferase [Thermoproteota archaeon]
MIVGMIAAWKTFPTLVLVFQSSIAMLMIALSVYIYNDLTDIELDRICAKIGESHYIHRPLITGKALPRDAKILILSQTVIGLCFGLSINLLFFFFLTLYLILGILYSAPKVHFKERLIFKQLIISIGQAIATLAGGSAAGFISLPVIYSAALFFILTFSVVPVTDIRDIFGDRKMGRKTFPIAIGPKATIEFAIIVVITTLCVSLAVYTWLGFNFAFAVLLAASFFMLLTSIFKIYKNLTNPNLIEIIIKRNLRPIFIILQISILIGLIPL